MIKIKDAMNKICPLNNNNCIVDKCVKWEFTKEYNMREYRPKAACKCGNKTTEYEFCYDCGNTASVERAPRFYRDSILNELEYEDKEGRCTL